jgi:hypothetical protein
MEDIWRGGKLNCKLNGRYVAWEVDSFHKLDEALVLHERHVKGKPTMTNSLAAGAKEDIGLLRAGEATVAELATYTQGWILMTVPEALLQLLCQGSGKLVTPEVYAQRHNLPLSVMRRPEPEEAIQPAVPARLQ